MEKQKGRLDKPSMFISLFLLATLVIATIAAPVATTQFLDDARIEAVDVLGFYFLIEVLFCLGFNLWLAFSKYGSIKMGKEKPDYSMFSWIAMMFCAAMGTSILYWSAIEWVYYLQWPPFGYAAMSADAMEISVAYSFFHWGFSAWSVYAVGAVTLAYRYYLRKKPDLTLQAACEGALGNRIYGKLGTVINVVFIFGILGGLTITYGTGIPMLSNNLANLIGTPENFTAYALMIVVVTVTFATSTFIGLAKGMQFISRITTWCCVALCAAFLVLVCPSFILDNFVQSLGIIFDKFITMSTYLDPIRGSGFPQGWTCFYWAWWICLAPWMWVFIAKVSKGRSIKAIVATVTLSGSIGSFIFFGTISSYGINRYLAGALNVIEIMADRGANQVISEVSLSLPGGKIVLALWLLTGFCLLVTTMDSAAYSLAAAVTRGLKPTEDPPKQLRLCWAILLSVSPLCLMYAGQFIEGGVPLGGLQAVLILTGIPVSVTVFLAMYSIWKWLREDFGHKTRDEIVREFMDPEKLAELDAKRAADIPVAGD